MKNTSKTMYFEFFTKSVWDSDTAIKKVWFIEISNLGISSFLKIIGSKSAILEFLKSSRHLRTPTGVEKLEL